MAVPLMSDALKRSFIHNSSTLSQTTDSIEFPNPLGLAAGFDKNAEYVDLMANLGFGFIEIGTVTPKPQDGNPRPRMFRLPKDKALINRMGFNNGGIKLVKRNLKKRKNRSIIIGANIGKNKVTPNERAVDDYVICFNELHPLVDYFTINVSSPNTPGLRELQNKEALSKLLTKLVSLNKELKSPKPIYLKIAPDITNAQLDDIIDLVEITGIQGINCTNTTISREDLKTDSSEIEMIGNGGLSGAPLTNRSQEVLKYVISKRDIPFTIFSVGGIYNEEEAKKRLELGANLIQVYTGMIYEGPGLIKRILKGLET